MKSDIDYLYMAYLEAMKSVDPSTQNGAIIVSPDGEIVARGRNEVPPRIAEMRKRWERPLKYSFIEHAERSAIYDAAKHGKSCNGMTMYCPWYACAECARAIILVGIVEVVGHRLSQHLQRESWQDSIQHADGMLSEAGIHTRWVDCKFGMKIRFDGKLVEV